MYKKDDFSWTGITGNLPTPVYDLRSSPNAGFIYAATASGIYKFDIEPAAPVIDSTRDSAGHPKIYWAANQEIDLKENNRYSIYRYFTGCLWLNSTKYACDDPYGDEELIASTNNTFYTDRSVGKITPRYPFGFYLATYTVVAADAADNNSLRSAYGNVTVQIPVPNKTVVKALPDEEGKPKFFALEENYPNPFNPITQINYALPSDEHVTLKVYNILGKEVATLIDEFQTASYKSINFDATNLSSGVYYYRLQAGTFVEMKKMLLLK